MKLYTSKDAARILGVKQSTLYTWEKKGDIPKPVKTKKGKGGHRRYTMEHIKEIARYKGIDIKSKTGSYALGTEVVFVHHVLDWQTVRVLMFAGFYRVEVKNTDTEAANILYRTTSRRKAIKYAKVVSKWLTKGVWN